MSDRKGPLSYSLAGGMTEAYFNRQPSVLTESIEDPNGALISQRNTLTGNHGRFEALNLSPRVNLALGPGETLTSQSFVNVNNFTGFNTENITTKVGVLPQFSNNNLGVVSKFEMARTDLNWVKKLAEGAKIDVKFGVNWNHRVNNVDSMLGDISSALLLDRKVDSSASDKGFTTVGKYSTPYAQDHALAFGWDAGVSQRGEDRIEHDFTPAGVQSGFISEVYDASVKRVAVFTQDEWNVTPRWSVYFGLRWEGLDTTSEGNTYASVHNKSSVWSPLFQTLWKLPDTKADQVRLGLTRTYKAPATNTLIPRRFIATNNSVNTPDSQGNPNLKPELALGLDASYEHFLPDGGLLSASTYVRRIQDITRRSLNLINGLWVAMPINDGVAMTRGIELEAKMPLRSLDKTLPAIDMRANMSRNWSTIDTVPGPNNRLDQQTPFSANIGADWKLDSLPLTLGGNFNIQTGGPVRISDKQFTYTAAKRSLDMYGLWKFTAQNQLRVSLANMLHQNNITENDYVDTFGSSQAVTLTPTNVIVRAQLEIKF
jgi:outer membrane receptor protein involved in Fe transport